MQGEIECCAVLYLGRLVMIRWHPSRKGTVLWCISVLTGFECLYNDRQRSSLDSNPTTHNQDILSVIVLTAIIWITPFPRHSSMVIPPSRLIQKHVYVVGLDRIMDVSTTY